MKQRLPVLLSLLLILCACTVNPAVRSSPYVLYFLSTSDHGPAIVSQPYSGDGVPSPEQLLQELLRGPESDDLLSPFPQGLSLRRCIQDQTHITVDFSEQYSALSDISLTLADYCVVLTLCQLEGIDSVEITVSGQPVSYRSHQHLTPDEVIQATYER